MKSENTRVEDHESSGSSFIQERIVCRINALIEVMNLPAESLNVSDNIAIAKKLQELSKDKTLCLSPLSQDFQLNFIINRMCENSSELEKVLAIGEQKYEEFLKAKKLF